MAIVTIDGVIKATKTGIKKAGKDDQSVVGQVVIEFELNSFGVKAMSDLLKMQNNFIRAQISDVQIELPRAAGQMA